ncbi:hypothetical protein FHX82_006025 [Amycolatopsis bartoniae]|nr:hypothetical protein [Amycolatopsis bartoniae]
MPDVPGDRALAADPRGGGVRHGVPEPGRAPSRTGRASTMRPPPIDAACPTAGGRQPGGTGRATAPSRPGGTPNEALTPQGAAVGGNETPPATGQRARWACGTGRLALRASGAFTALSQRPAVPAAGGRQSSHNRRATAPSRPGVAPRALSSHEAPTPQHTPNQQARWACGTGWITFPASGASTALSQRPAVPAAGGQSSHNRRTTAPSRPGVAPRALSSHEAPTPQRAAVGGNAARPTADQRARWACGIGWLAFPASGASTAAGQRPALPAAGGRQPGGTGRATAPSRSGGAPRALSSQEALTPQHTPIRERPASPAANQRARWSCGTGWITFPASGASTALSQRPARPPAGGRQSDTGRATAPSRPDSAPNEALTPQRPPIRVKSVPGGTIHRHSTSGEAA